jgi:alkylation response protein AidB-like acyl-CoA dehydrogenase
MIERARSIVPLVAEAAEETERESRLPQRVVDALVEAGLFKMLAPRELGGSEADFRGYVLAAETLGAADASTGWCIVQAGHAGFTMAPRLPRDAAMEVFGQPDAALAGGSGPVAGRADEVDGGYVLNGTWDFASGCMHCTWFDGRALVWREGKLLINEAGASPVHSMAVPRKDVEIVDHWNVRGMRGTGSHRYIVKDAFVPRNRAIEMYGAGGWAQGPMYRIPGLGAAHLAFTSVAFGAAGAMLDDLIALATVKTPGLSRQRLAESATLQATVARAQGKLRSARAYRDQAAAMAWAEARAGRVSTAARAEVRLAGIHGLDAAVEVVEACYRAAGTTAIFDHSTIHRRFQDVHVMSQQLFGRTSHYENIGKLALGIEFDRGVL